MSYCDLTDEQIQQLIDAAYQRGWIDCLDDIQKARLEKEGKDELHGH